MACAVSVRTLYGLPGGALGVSVGNKEKCDNAVSGDFHYSWMPSSPSGNELPESARTCSCGVENSSANIRQTSATDNKESFRVGSRDEMRLNTASHEAERKDPMKSCGLKRKSDCIEDDYVGRIPSKRISPFLNTPKERKEERRKILKISIQKLRAMEDPEHFLMRSVLINNTLKKVQKEVREEKKSYQGYKSCIYRLKPVYDYDVLNNNYSAEGLSHFYDDPFAVPEDGEKITDEITESLCNGLKEASRPAAPIARPEQSISEVLNNSHFSVPEVTSCPSLSSLPSDTDTHEISSQTNVDSILDSDKIPTEMEVTVIKSLIRVLGDT